MSNKTVVLAIFKDEASADTAATSLKDSGVARGDAIGVLVLDEKGELKADKVGKRSWGKGAGIGAVVALVHPGRAGGRPDRRWACWARFTTRSWGWTRLIAADQQ